MLDYNKAEARFREYIKQYDINHNKISRKVGHILRVVDLCEELAKGLGLDDENIVLAKIIALLHDIARFEQARLFDNFRDYETFDHADYGVKLLFEDGLIREFINDDKHDDIIMKAIKNHNKLEIEEGLSEKELLHSKIIRDADKMDNFVLLPKVDVKYTSVNTEEEVLVKQTISDEIFSKFMDCKGILRSDTQNGVDMWVCHIGWVFDLNFDVSLRFVKENKCINAFVDRFAWENEETIERMEAIRECANRFIAERLEEI